MYGNEYSYQKDDVYFIFEGCIYPLAFCDGEFPLTPKTIKKSIYNIFNDDEIYINTQGDKHTPLRREEGYKKLRKEYNKARYSLGRIGILNAESFYLLNYVLGAFEID